jgi:hypothetical protein
MEVPKVRKGSNAAAKVTAFTGGGFKLILAPETKLAYFDDPDTVSAG